MEAESESLAVASPTRAIIKTPTADPSQAIIAAIKEELAPCVEMAQNSKGFLEERFLFLERCLERIEYQVLLEAAQQEARQARLEATVASLDAIVVRIHQALAEAAEKHEDAQQPQAVKRARM
jgi:hypothetical protein